MINGMKIGIGVTGSFCSLSHFMTFLKQLAKYDVDIYVFMSFKVLNYDTRFYQALQLRHDIEDIINKKIIVNEVEAELFGPKIPLDMMVVYPCSGNTLAKLCHGINDNAVTMAVKSHLRRQRPVIIAVSTNDALSGSAKNIGTLLNMRHNYFVPLRQDDWQKKPTSIVADFTRIPETLHAALEGRQFRRLFL